MQTQQPIANRRFAALSRENDGLSADGLRPAPPWLESVTAGRAPGPDDFEGDKGLDEQALANAGPNVVRADFGRAREMAVAQGREVSLPLYGKIAAGMPIEALANESEYLDVPTTLLGNGQYYALQVEGDSMIEAGIHDGDYVIIERGDTAHNGDIVVALVDNYEVTLKRLKALGHGLRCRQHPLRNPYFRPRPGQSAGTACRAGPPLLTTAARTTATRTTRPVQRRAVARLIARRLQPQAAQASDLSQGLSVQGRSSGVVEHGGDVLLCFLGPKARRLP